jgi:two-component system NtrC family sensor kinase
MNFKVCRYVLALVFIQILSYTLHAQNSKLDSLDQLIAKAKTDTERINLNIKKINILSRSNLDTAIYLDKQLLKEAEKINFYKGIVALHSQLASNYSFKGSYGDAKENIQFLEKFVKPTDSVNIANIYAAYGMMYGIQAKYDSSIKFYLQAIAINERLNNVKELGANYANMAIGYQQLANFPKALEYQQRSLNLAETQKDEQLQAKTLLNMGITYEEMDDTLKAEQHYLAARNIAVKNEFKIVELYVYTNLSSLYINEKRWSEGYTNAIKAAELSSTTGDMGIKAASLAKAATALANQNKFDEATALSKQAIQLADSSTQPLNISQALDAMAATLYLQKRYKEAIPYFEKSFKALNGAANYEQAYVISYKSLSDCYEKTGDYVKALANYKLAAGMEDSLKRKSNIRRATELSMNYDFAKKQEVLAAEKKRDDEIAKTKQGALIIGLVLVFILAVVGFSGYSSKRKANKLLQLQKQQIEGTLSELRTTQTQLIQSEKMASLGELTAGIAHEIQNPLNFVNNFSDVNKELLAEMKDEMNKGNLADANAIADNVIGNEEKINHHGKRADAIVKGMLQHSRASSGQKEPFDLNALADEYLRLSYHGLRAKDKSFSARMKTDFDTGIPKINIVRQDIGRVLLNLYNNAFYAVTEKANTLTSTGQTNGYEPTITVTTRKSGNIAELTVKDNGNGIPQRVLDKIFQPFFTTKPTGEGTGLGLSLSYDVIKAHGGEIKVDTKEGEGTEFIIQLSVV